MHFQAIPYVSRVRHQCLRNVSPPSPLRSSGLHSPHLLQYAVKSQLAVHGRTPEEALVLVSPRPGEELIREEDILTAIEKEGESLALVLFTGVQYYTGQFFDLPKLCSAAHAVGARFGVDLAHAVGNLPLFLHDWNVDFAAWCSYKYLNSGPGGIAGLFVHSKFDSETMESMPFFAGWWGHERESRFQMKPDFKPMVGAGRFQLSNPAVFQTAALR
jgi:kynureninase